MADKPLPVPDTQPRDDFVAARGQAASGNIDAEFAKLLSGPGGGATSAAAAAPAASPNSGGVTGAGAEGGGAGVDARAAAGAAAPPGVQQSGLPLGLQIEQAANDPAAGVVHDTGSGASGGVVPPGPTWEDAQRRLIALVQAGKGPGDPEYDQAIKDRALGLARLASGFMGPLNGAGEGAEMVAAAAGRSGMLDTAKAALAKLFGGDAAEDAVKAAGTAASGDAGSGAAAAAPPPRGGTAETGEAAGGTAGAGDERSTPPPFAFVMPGAPPTIRVTPEIRAKALDWLQGVTDTNPVQASLGQIADPAVMDHAIEGVARALPAGEVRGDEAVRLGAYSIAMQPADIAGNLDRLAGPLPDAEKIAAHAMLINSGAEQLITLWQKAIETSAPADIEAAVRGYALQSKIVGDWQNAGNEMGRAFRMRQIAQASRDDYSDAVNRIIQSAGMDNIEDAGRKIAALQTPQQVSGFTGTMRWMGSRDGLLYGWYNMLLGPKTVAKKLLTDVTMPVWNLAERSTAERFGSGAVPAGETAQLVAGYGGAFGDAIRAAGRGLLAGRSQFMGDFSTLEGLQRTRNSIIANGGEMDPAGGAAGQPTRNALAYLRAALPTSWIAGIDDFAKTMHYRAELRAGAYRDAASKGLAGPELGSAVQDGIANPSPALHSQALQRAQQLTFTEPLTGIAEKLADAADSFNIPVGNTRYEIPAGRILLPFARTPTNFVRFMYRASPLPAVFPSAAFKAEMAAGGASRDLALAKMGLGTGTIMATAGLALGGMITGNGPTDPKLRKAWLEAGNQPYSVQIPGQRALAYQPEPFAMMMGAVADTIGLMKFAREEDNDHAALSLGLGLGHVFLSRTYMQGLSDFLDAVQNPDREGGRYAAQLVASLAVPRTASDVAGAIDPWQRAHYGMLDAIEARIPFLSQNLPPLRDTWGRPIPLRDAYLPPFSGSGFAHVVSPITEGPASAEPIDQWRWEHRADFFNGDAGIPKPNRTLSFQQGQGVKANVQLNPQQYDRFQALAGNALPDPATKRGLLDQLNALVTEKAGGSLQREWSQSSDGERALMVQRLVSQYRSAAKQQLMRENPDIQQAVQAQFGQRRQQLQPGPSAVPAMPSTAPAAGPTAGMPRLE